MGAARDLSGAARHAAYAAGQAGAVAHVAAHELGASAYAIKSSAPLLRRGRVSMRDEPSAGSSASSCPTRPDPIRELVLDDQRNRNDLCWSVFDT